MADFKLPDLGGLMQAAQRMQEDIARAQEELGNKQVSGASGGGMVTVTANGRMEILSIAIDPAAIDARDVAMLQDLVTAATNQALAKAKELASQELARATGGLSIPGLPPIL